MSDRYDLPLRPVVPRELLVQLVVASVESENGSSKLRVGALFPPSVSQLHRVRLEALCRRIILSYAPSSAPPFTTPASGADPALHTQLENDLAYEAYQRREEYKAAMCEILGSDLIFQLTPPEGRNDLLDLRQLLRELPEEGG